MRISSVLGPLRNTFSGQAARHYTAEIARFHRIQASPGYRAAAHWLLETLQAQGLDAWIERFPARSDTRFWTLPSFEEWECRSATLDWLGEDGPQRLCDLRATPLAVIQRSISVVGEFQVVDIGEANAEDYQRQDVSGKLVLTRAPVSRVYQEAVVKRRAAGILWDNISGRVPGRSPVDLPDARQYASFWWGEQQPDAWGFVLTPRQGDTLRHALARGEQVRMRAEIDAHFSKGELEVVVARIPGRTQDAVLGMAHLCHPQGFANDNASGAASLLETAVALRRLIDQQVLSPPDRSIYFLWMPEMTGTYAWLQAHEDLIPHIVAGINLDMVGEHQEQTGSVLVLERPPDALPSFAPDLLDYLRHELLLEQPNLSNTDHYARVRYATTAFSGGSDHMITSDPTVGIPTPMLIQWPDRFYHTTADTLDKVDPASLALAGTLAGTYLYWLARAGRDEVAWLGATMTACFELRLSRDTHRLATRLLEGTPDQTPLPSLEEFVAYRHRRALESLTTLRHLASCDDLLPRWRQALSDTRDRILARALDLTATASHPSPPPPPESSPHLVPIRRYRGPIMDYGTPTFLGLSPEDTDTWQQLYRDIPDWRSLRALAEYWADGQRSLAEIERLVWLESGHNLGGSVETYFHLLESAGLVELRRRPD